MTIAWADDLEAPKIETETTQLEMRIDDLELEICQYREALRIRDEQLRAQDEELGALRAVETIMLDRIEELGTQVRILATGCAARKRKARTLALAKALGGGS